MDLNFCRGKLRLYYRVHGQQPVAHLPIWIPELEFISKTNKRGVLQFDYLPDYEHTFQTVVIGRNAYRRIVRICLTHGAVHNIEVDFARTWQHPQMNPLPLGQSLANFPFDYSRARVAQRG